MSTHIIGLKCPDCGHEWPGHAMIGVAYEICPRCDRRIRDGNGGEEDAFVRPASGDPCEGSREVPGCDRHASPLPCRFCPPA